MPTVKLGNDIFDQRCDLIDVTSLNRPDTSWVAIDARGHQHRWYVGATPATSYNPGAKHETPTLTWIKDGEEYWEDDDSPHDVGHLECRECGEHITPGFRADSCTQYIPGFRWYRINGESVSSDEFCLRLEQYTRQQG